MTAGPSTMPANNVLRHSLPPQAARPLRILGLAVGLIAIVVVGLLSLRIGSLPISTADAWNAIVRFDPSSYDQTVVRSLRLPRTVIGLAVGGALGVAGGTTQAVTRNPLADPSILGVSSGASFAIVTATYYGGLTAPVEYVWFAFGGALIAAVVVFAIGSTGKGGASPAKLVLSGLIVASLLGAWTSALLLLDEQTMDVVRMWLAGSVAGRSLSVLWIVSPFLLGGTLACLFMGHQLNVLSLGEDEASALGMNTTRIRLLSSGFVVLITGAAVAAAGPIAFVGLATPHIVRSIIGGDYRWVLPYSFIFGAILLTSADIIGRVVARPGELQVGIVTALTGAPFLIYLARRKAVTN